MEAGGFFPESGKRSLKLEAGSAVLHRKCSTDSSLAKSFQGDCTRYKRDSSQTGSKIYLKIQIRRSW